MWIEEASAKLGVSLRPTTQNQANGPCPKCGGKDRFCVFQEGNYWCRQCQDKGWWVETPPTKEELAALKESKGRTQAALLEEMHHCALWLQYHQHPQTVNQWQEQRVDSESVTRWGLGFCDSCPQCRESPSLTIPVFYHGQLCDIRHRLTRTENAEGGKYRTHLAGLPPSFFNLDSIQASVKTIYVVEGEKKVIKLCSLGLTSVVGCPGLAFFHRLPHLLNRLTHPNQHVVFVPDPGETVAPLIRQVAQELSVKRKSVVELWDKPDDFLETYGPKAFLNCLRQPRPL